MGGSQKSKRITWASDLNLCQVRLFLSEESPSKVGTGTKHHQAKAFLPDDNLPPGFGVANLWRVKLPKIPLIKWRCPPRFEVNVDWQVVAGEESKEIRAQKQREMRVLEAIYPRPSTIPPNPSMVTRLEDSTADDRDTPVVPLTPIEEDDTALETSLGSLTTNSTPMISQPHQLPHGSSSSQNSARINQQGASTPVMSNGSNNDGQPILIDHDLLIKLLRNPEMIEQLIRSHSAPSSVQNTLCSSSQSMPAVGVQKVAPSSTHTMPSIGVQKVTPSISQSMPSVGVQKVTPSISQSMPSVGVQNVTPSISRSMPSVGVQKVPPSISQSMTSTGVQTVTPSSTRTMPSTSTQYVRDLSSPFAPINNAINGKDPHTSHISRPEVTSPATATANGPFYPPQIRTGFTPAPTPLGAPVTKDINYYKSLIQQHGGEKRDASSQFDQYRSSQPMVTAQESLNFTKSKPKIMKPCIYFNSSRGCRNGANCAYQHNISAPQRVSVFPEVQSAKRMKLDREIAGI